MKIFGLTVLFILIVFHEVPQLLKEKMYRELLVFSGLMAIAMGLSYGFVLGLPIPSPAKAAELLFRPISLWVQKQ